MLRSAGKQNRLLRYADELVAKLESHISKAIEAFDAGSIHQARVATRRLAAASDVFKPISTRGHRQDFTRVLRKLRHRLGPLRDTDVMLSRLDDFKQPNLAPAMEWLKIGLTAQQQKLRAKITRKVDVQKTVNNLRSWAKLRAEWLEAAEGLHGLIGESLHLQLDEFVEHANAVARVEGAISTAVTLDPHALRIAGKSLRYTLELAVAGGHPLPAAITRSFKRMQDALGSWHDNVVFAEDIFKRSIKVDLVLHNADVQAIALDVAKLAIKQSKRQLLIFNQLWRDRGVVLTGVIRQSFPLTEPADDVPVIAPQTDLDPVGLESPAADRSDPVPAQDEISAA